MMTVFSHLAFHVTSLISRDEFWLQYWKKWISRRPRTQYKSTYRSECKVSGSPSNSSRI